MQSPRLFIGPVSKNTIDSVIELCNEGENIGFIPSRRQIDYKTGYVNNWTTKEFVNYVKKHNDSIIITRDHSGPGQGSLKDDGIHSIIEDTKNYFNFIHIDPWKIYKKIDEVANHSINMIETCLRYNSSIRFEVGTEESIRKYSPKEFELYLKLLQSNLGEEKFKSIKYGVVQGGTKLSMNKNVGNFNSERMKEFINICKSFQLLSKEHNGDYLSKEDIQKKFNLGLNCINIAPECGFIESQCILNELEKAKDTKAYEMMYEACLNSQKWIKWIPKEKTNKILKDRDKILVKLSGHYVFTNNCFKIIKKNYPNLDMKIKIALKKRIREILCQIK